MSKKKFHSLCRYVDKMDNSMKIGYLPREGFDVPNDLGFDLAVYHSKEKSKAWYVVDTRTGLSVGEGDTKKAAIDMTLDRLSKLDMDKYNECVQKAVEQYGECPGHGVMYNFCGGID